MDEEGFQRTMRYIFTFIEKVTGRSISSFLLAPLPSADANIKIKGKASGEHRRKALPALPPL